MPLPVLAVVLAGALIGFVWILAGERGRSGGSGSYAVWILVPFILAVCGAGVWLLVGTLGVTNFYLLH